jgi:hypothetical protein
VPYPVCASIKSLSVISHPVILKMIFVPTGTGGIVTGLWVG